MRHDIYEGVQFYILKGIKPNYSELGRQYNCDPRTVKKYYEAGEANKLERLKKRQQTKKASKLDPFKEIIDEKIELGCTAMAIFKYIEKKVYEGRYTILREYCKNEKLNDIKKVTIRVETNLGIAAQYDEVFLSSVTDDGSITPSREYINTDYAQSFLNFGVDPKVEGE